jgi:hypothetical protein
MPLGHIVLSSGRSIRLTELRMSSTYGGNASGPCKHINDLIRWLWWQAERAFPSKPVHHVPPSREYPDETADAFGPVEVPPSVACVGVLDSTALDPVMDGSTLVVACSSQHWRYRRVRMLILRFAESTGRSWPRTTSCSAVC